MFYRLIVLSLTLSPALLTAQIDRFATNADGSVAYFSSSLRLAADPSEPDWPKIFRYRQDTDRIELAYQVPNITFISPYKTFPYILTAPDLSSDGSVLSFFDGGGSCTGGSACIGFVPSYARVIQFARGSDSSINATGAHVSRNGRYAFYPVLFGYPFANNAAALADLQSGQTYKLGQPIQTIQTVGDGYQCISNSGQILIGNTLFDPMGSTSTPLNLTRPPTQERLSADGKRIIYETGNPPNLVEYDVDSGRETTVAQGAQPWLSDDGSLLLYLQAGQVFLLQLNSPAPPTQLTSEMEGIANAVLSGGKNIVYAVTNRNRILRIQTADRTVRELSGAITSINSVARSRFSLSGTGVPGSLLHIDGVAIPVDTAPDAVQIGGLNAPVQSGTPTSIDIQIPWELSLPDLNGSKFPLTFRSETHSVFAPPVITVAYVSGIFVRQDPSAPPYASPGVIAHQDFRGLVSDADPAAPEEILHFYMTGLGPIMPAIATGQITPAGPLYSVTGPPVCNFYIGDSLNHTIIPAPLLFTGLAPGTLGVYQVDVMMPDTHLAGPWAFTCQGYLPKVSVSDSIPLPTLP